MDGATELSHSVQIDAPAARVWQVLADLEAVQHYNSSVQKAAYLPGQREGVGAGRQCTVKEGVLKERVIAWDPGRALEMELVESPWPIVFMRWRTELVERDGGTLIQQKMRYKLKFGLLGALLNAMVMRGKMDRQLSSIFASLKRYVEEGGRKAAGTAARG
jgi:ligand-binding SRPBCC domain-containing protein